MKGQSNDIRPLGNRPAASSSFISYNRYLLNLLLKKVEDVVAMLEVISSKVETLATKEEIEYLAGKLGQHDLEIDRLKRIK